MNSEFIPEINWSLYRERLQRSEPIKQNGRIIKVIGLVLESLGPAGCIGEICLIYPDDHDKPIPAEIVGFRDDRVLLMPLGEMHGVRPGCQVIGTGIPHSIPVGREMLGRILNGLGEFIDDKPPIIPEKEYAVYNSSPHPLRRQRINEPIQTGIKCIDGLLTCGKGQRIGIFAGSGVGKSVLMGMVAKYTSADVNVIALIGERGREVRDFIERDLGEEGLKKSVVVVATSDSPALVRILGGLTAITVAEYFRDKGLDVMFMMDSVTRFAMAQREVGLAIGEPPATRGYTPSVFALLPKFLERAGRTEHSGSITGMYTVLVEGDDMNEPVADQTRSILDGHIVLSRQLAEENHYPSIDILNSVSRVMTDLVDPEHNQAAQKLREAVAIYRRAQDLINIGAYKKGNNPQIDWALKYYDSIIKFLRQGTSEHLDFQKCVSQLVQTMS